MKSMLKSLMSVAVAALAFTSCSNDATEEVTPNGGSGSKTLVVNASIDQTRTVMAADHVKLDWAADDQIHLYIGAEAAEAEAKHINPVTGGEITGVTYNANDKVYAYYSLPEEGKSSSGPESALINIVQVQTQTDANIFAGKNLPMVASSSIENGIANLVFKPVGCVLAFNVYGQGKTAGEKIKSIKFETSVGCYGYDSCDLTADEFKYEAYSNGKNATVTLTNAATIGASKPSDTKVGENQIYLVVAPAEYPAGSKFTVTTDANNAYTFTTKSVLDCKTKNARVVNLNLAQSEQLKPSINVPTVDEQPSEGVQELVISGIEFKNFTDGTTPEVGVYKDAELNSPAGEDFWLTFVGNAELSADGTLNCRITANDGGERIAYIGIKRGNVQAAIAITQLAKGVTISKIEMSAADIINNGTTDMPNNGYGTQNVSDPSTYYTWQMNNVTFGGARICQAPNGDYTGTVRIQSGKTTEPNKHGFFGNASDLKKITKVVVVSKHKSKAPTETLYVGTSVYPRGQNAVTHTDMKQEDQTYTETFNISGDYGYFALVNEKNNTLYIESVTVYYRVEQVQ